ncbi:hypothetical protein Cantr_06490 [Candida viswanathii]|uniref:DSC E3 ubiquitin ligase complex subunit 2 n=1 Tax=Candida viswanathii TaxID=5486 RepID=A0A367XWW0_9ASCO|nr:hypothetical protein Cantr_06490 [Candida viswanathii]
MAQLTPIRGFTNTPTTKTICVLSTIIPLTLSILSLKYVVKFAIDPYIIEYNQFWRILVYQLSVINESDYLITVLLWFQYKVLERYYGSRKYLSVITLFYLYNAIACLFIMSLGQLVIYYGIFIVKVFMLGFSPEDIHYELTFLNEITPGPLGIISSLYICYGRNIPVSYYFTILLKKPKDDEETLQEATSSPSKELNLTNMFPVHILYTLLLLNNGLQSIIPCLVGLLIGKLYVYELLPGGSSWLIPNFVFQLFINPGRRIKTWVYLIRRRFSRYQRLSDDLEASVPVSAAGRQPGESVIDETQLNEEADDNDEILDEARQQESQIRAETPVRPLGSQFLDTFRS